MSGSVRGAQNTAMIKIKPLSKENYGFKRSERVLKSILMGNLTDWDQQNFSVKGQVVNILAFVGYMWSPVHFKIKKIFFK